MAAERQAKLREAAFTTSAKRGARELISPHRGGAVMRTKRGWTLIELLVVMAIIIVLAGITYAVVVYALEKSSQARCISNLRQIGVALKLYMEDYKQADWDTEVGSVNCEQVRDEQSHALVARWGFPESLEQLVSAGYLKGGEDVLRCRSARQPVTKYPVHYHYRLPIRVNIPFLPDDLSRKHNLLCQLQSRMHEYPIVMDINHWHPYKGGVYIILRLNDKVESMRVEPLRGISSADL
jgi:prepilin-type N-terminal cleavage/methylation domain-containing protein